MRHMIRPSVGEQLEEARREAAHWRALYEQTRDELLARDSDGVRAEMAGAAHAVAGAGGVPYFGLRMEYRRSQFGETPWRCTIWRHDRHRGPHRPWTKVDAYGQTLAEAIGKAEEQALALERKLATKDERHPVLDEQEEGALD